MLLAAERTQRRTPSPRLWGQSRVRDGGLVLSQHSFSEILHEKKKKGSVCQGKRRTRSLCKAARYRDQLWWLSQHRFMARVPHPRWADAHRQSPSPHSHFPPGKGLDVPV